jgi:probable HAF family extracellular repeat protein
MKLTFKTLDDQADPTFNQLLGINNDGVIAGYFGSGAQGAPNKGYTLKPGYDQHNYSNENFPGSVQTQVTGINNEGVTVGFWADANNADLMNNNYGFVDVKGHFYDVVDPLGKSADGGMTVEQLLGVNDHDKAVGFWTDNDGNNHGFTYNVKTGHYSEVNVSGFAGTTATAINNEGDIAGFVSNNGGLTDEGFIKTGNKVQILAGPKGATSLMVLGINDKGQVVGSFTDATMATHGFLYDEKSNTYTTIDDPHALKSGPNAMTVVNGLNDKGQLVGFYLDGNGNTDGMLIQIHHS